MKNFFPTAGRAIETLRSAGEAAISLLYPPHCAMCEADTPSGSHLCEACANTVRPISAPFCHQCSQPYDGAIEGEFVCANCEGRDFAFDCAVAAFRAEGVIREFVHSFKYEHRFHLRHQLAQWMAAGLADDRIRDRPPDALVPVPLHPRRQRHRTFNQAIVLAEIVARRAAKPVLHALKRVRDTPTQTRLDREKRMENLRGAFSAPKPAAVIGRHLLLIDDIFTTGSTVHECARTLCAAGAASVRVLTVARA